MPAWTIGAPTHIATSALTRAGSIDCISPSSFSAVRHGLRGRARPDAPLQFGDDAPQLECECDLHDTGHERERRDERQQGNRSGAWMSEHDHPERDREQSAEHHNSDRPALSGRTNARAISNTAMAIAHAAIA